MSTAVLHKISTHFIKSNVLVIVSAYQEIIVVIVLPAIILEVLVSDSHCNIVGRYHLYVDNFCFNLISGAA